MWGIKMWQAWFSSGRRVCAYSWSKLNATRLFLDRLPVSESFSLEGPSGNRVSLSSKPAKVNCGRLNKKYKRIISREIGRKLRERTFSLYRQLGRILGCA